MKLKVSSAYLHDNCDACDEVSCLLSQFGILVVESPLDDAAELW